MLLLAPQNKVHPNPLQVNRSLSYGPRILPICIHDCGFEVASKECKSTLFDGFDMV
jgi:hypothetical protein